MKPNRKLTPKEKKEMIDEINAWMNSSVYNNLHRKLEEKKKRLLENLDIKKALKQKKIYMMTKDELIEYCRNIIEFNKIQESDTEWINSVLNHSKDIRTVLESYQSILIDYYIYLYDYIKTEDYEVAALVKEVIEIEKKELIKITVTYYGLTEPEILAYIKSIDDACFKKINEMLDGKE